MLWTATSLVSQVKMNQSPQKPTAAITVLVSCDGGAHTRGGAEFCRAHVTSPPPQVHAPLEKVQNVHKLCRLVTEEGFCCTILTFNPLNSDVTIQY